MRGRPFGSDGRFGDALGLVAGLALAAYLGLAPGAAVADAGAKNAPASDPTQTDVASAPPEPIYRPPARGKPRARVSGGVRGAALGVPALHTLVPDHTGRTVSAQPSLFWALDGQPPEDAKLIFTLTDSRRVEPLVEAELALPTRPGIQRIDLGAYAVKLERGTEYQWSVALVVDPDERSSDVVSMGWIDRVAPPVELADAELALAGAAPARRYAHAGLWYDALAAAARGTDRDSRALRDALLREAGLEEAIAPTPN